MSNHYPTSTTPAARATVASRKWFINLKLQKQERLALASTTATNSENTVSAATTVATSNAPLSMPIGYGDISSTSGTTREDDDHLIARRSWDIALQPIKQLPMNMIFAWMAGNSFSLMSIMIVVMLFMKPIQSIFSLSSAFASLDQEGVAGNIWLLKAIYFLGNLTHLGLALYKCQSMGLLPTYNSDWIAFADQQTQMEMTIGGLSYF